ncbi:MAG: transposase [Deltaproteobacteria bacterium]|nr:transposase [Deltaproteobacteria bacterium]MBW2629789.1 transposase [Deltaproteobacteria bacterium]
MGIHAAAAGDETSRSYVRRTPERGVLHRVVCEHLQTFLWELDRHHEERGAPLFVKREFQRFVRCGVLAHGFARFRCGACGTDRLVAFSCKGRGFCPSCGGRRMTERAAHLIDHVLPRAPVRQWVLSLPFELRYRLAWDHKLCRAVLAVYTRALLGFYRKRAKASGYRDGRTGTVTVIQRFGGALNLNVHFHTLAVDGVFVREPDGSLSFAAAKAPTDDEVEALLGVIRKRVLRLLVRRGLLCEEGGESSHEMEAPPLHALYAASVRQRVAMGRRAGATVLRLGDAPTITAAPPKRRRQARLGGFDLHANTCVRARNRPKLERLCRYLLRPPVAEDRLSFAPDGRVLVRLKTPWRDGTSHIALEPQELLEKLAALIPRPYTNLIVYHGVLAPNARWRGKVVGFGTGAKTTEGPASSASPTVARPCNRTWAELMRRGLEIDVLECPDCGGRMRFVAAIMLSSAIRRILRHLGLPADPVELAPARAPPELDDAWAC